MATDCKKLQGEIIENPEIQELNVEAMLAGFLRALLDEQKAEGRADARTGSAAGSCKEAM